MTDISNTDDIIDSRDVIARIDELRETLADRHEEESGGEASGELEAFLANDDSEEARELRALEALADEASGYADDWRHGAALVRDSYFRDYAMELAEDLDLIPRDAKWPATCIDWDQAARELQMEYTSVDFDGVTYWIR